MFYLERQLAPFKYVVKKTANMIFKSITAASYGMRLHAWELD